MDEGFDIEAVDIGSTDIVDVPDIEIEPFEAMDETALEPVMETPELVELEQAAEALEIEPIDDGVDLGYDYDEEIRLANEAWAAEQANESSTFENIITGATRNTEPGILAQVAGGSVTEDPTASDAAARLAHMGMGALPPAMEGFMDAAQRQHASSIPMVGVDYINVDGKPIVPGPMINTTDENGESIWVR